MNNIVIGKRASSNFFIKMETALDLDKKLYKLSQRFFGLTSGAWQALPKIDYILVFKTMYAKCESCSIEEFESDQGATYQLSLVHHKSRKIIVHETSILQEALNMAKKLQIKFQLPLRDAATNRRRPKWIK